jgi:hypothetical protein
MTCTFGSPAAGAAALQMLAMPVGIAALCVLHRMPHPTAELLCLTPKAMPSRSCCEPQRLCGSTEPSKRRGRHCACKLSVELRTARVQFDGRTAASQALCEGSIPRACAQNPSPLFVNSAFQIVCAGCHDTECSGGGGPDVHARSGAGVAMCASTATTPCLTMRTLARPCSPMRLSSAPMQGSCTSIPMKSRPKLAAATCAVASPAPKPISISTMRGARRPIWCRNWPSADQTETQSAGQARPIHAAVQGLCGPRVA